MSGLAWTFLGFARTYLLRMGGGFGFVTARNLAEKAPTLPHPLENRDIPCLSHACAVLVTSGGALAGAGLYPFVLVEKFTRALSVAAILMGASLPRTWAEFKKPGAKAA